MVWFGLRSTYDRARVWVFGEAGQKLGDVPRRPEGMEMERCGGIEGAVVINYPCALPLRRFGAWLQNQDRHRRCYAIMRYDGVIFTSSLADDAKGVDYIGYQPFNTLRSWYI